MSFFFVFVVKSENTTKDTNAPSRLPFLTFNKIDFATGGDYLVGLVNSSIVTFPPHGNSLLFS